MKKFNRLIFVFLFLILSCQHHSLFKNETSLEERNYIEAKAIATAVYLENYRPKSPILENSETSRSSRAPASLSSLCRKLVSSIGGLFDGNVPNHPMVALRELEGNELVKEYDGIIDQVDMFTLWRQTRRNARKITDATEKYLEQPLESTSERRVAYLSRQQANKIYDAVDNHPIASQCQLRRYDPQGNMGFCFGRAMTAHLELLNSGVQKDKIRKLWAVGHFKTGSASWRYHVTTIVQGPDGSWWAIDPIMGSPIEAGAWIRRMKGYDAGGDMVAFTSEAKRFGPSSPEKYSRNELNHSGYNDYFNDLLKSYREHDGPFNGEVFRPEGFTGWLLDQAHLLFKLSFSH